MGIRNKARGFTLLELLTVIAVIAILAAIAYPAYGAYIFRARAVPGIDAVTAYAAQLEQRFQDVGGYGGGANGRTDGPCGGTLPTASNFTFSCVASGSGANYLVTAVGSGAVAGLTYTLNDAGVRRTPAHPKGTPPGDCWSIRGGTCDS